MVRMDTVEPGFCSFRRRACSRALRSSGLKMAGSAARLTVPCGVMASFPTLRVSGTCLASTTMFKLIFLLVNDVRSGVAWMFPVAEERSHASAAKLLIYLVTAKESTCFLHSCAGGEQARPAACGGVPVGRDGRSLRHYGGGDRKKARSGRKGPCGHKKTPERISCGIRSGVLL